MLKHVCGCLSEVPSLHRANQGTKKASRLGKDPESLSLTAYQKGYLFERRVRRLLESQGYYVIRASGSRGPFDLVALKDGEKPLLIQCKVSKAKSKAKIQELVEVASKAGGIAVLVYREGKRLVVSRVGDPPTPTSTFISGFLNK